ncbi:MAG: hypothetical protein AAB289_13345, partial [Chloroflexota bacterium]
VAFLLTFSATTLMMSSLDARHAERALNQQQAFWAAEGELEAAIVQIRTTTPPSLSDGQCVAYTSRTLSSTADIASTANLCGHQVASSLYRLDSTGTAKTTTDRLSLVVSFASRPTFRFRYVSYSGAKLYTQEGAVTGSIDTQGLGVTDAGLTVSSFDRHHGTVANPNNTPRDDGYRRIKAYCYGQVYGQALLKTGADLSSSMMIDWHSGGRIHGNQRIYGSETEDPARGYLPSPIPTLPEVEIPQEAISLGSHLQLDEDERRCLAPGIYKANRLTLEEGAELCTTGKVELYLTGSGSSWSVPVIETAWGSKLYGQPAGSSEYARQYSPQDLLIAVKRNPYPSEEGAYAFVGGSRTAAAIYAPNGTAVRLLPSDRSSYGGGVFLGAVIAGNWIVNQGRVDCSTGTGTKSYFIYDRALGNLDMPIGRSSGSGSGSGSGVTILGWVDP